MFRSLVVLLLTMTLLCGCGEVVVFGHVVRQGDKTTEVKPAPTTSASTSAPAPASTPAPATTPATANANASSSSSTASVNNEPVQSPVVQHVNDVTLTLAPEVATHLSNDSRFDSKALLETIKAELQTRKLLEAGHATTGTTLEVYIDHYELHPNTNFVIFGATPNTGKLAGNLALRDEQDNAVTIAHIEAYAHVSVPQEGEDRQLLQPLYHEFAVTTADTLAGTHSASSDVRDQPPR